MKRSNYKILVEHRKVLTDLSLRQIGLFDKSILTLSSGALGISIVFLEKITNDTGIVDPIILFVAWGLLILAIVLNLVSYLTSWQENLNAIKSIDNAIDKQDSEIYYKDARSPSFTSYLNYLCMACFVFGVLSLSFFAYQNVSGVSNVKTTNSKALSESTTTKN